MPLVGSGLGAQLAVVPETTYGVYVPPTRFLEFMKEDLKKIKNTVQGGGIAAGRPAQLGARRKVTSQAGAGSIDLEVTNKLMGVLFNALCGGTVAPVQQAASAAYLQTHNLTVDSIGKSLTVQVGIPRTTAATDAFSFLGCKITSAEFKCAVDGTLQVSLELDAQKLDEAQTLATASYSTTIAPFHWGQASVKLGASYGAETVVDGVTEFTLKIERKMKDDRFYQGNLGLKREPITNDYLEVSGTISADYLDKTVFNDRFSADTATSIVWDFTGPIIASTYAERVTFKLPQAFLDGDTPTVDGPDVVAGDFAFVVQSDGTNPLAVIEYMSTDTVI